MRLIDRVRFKIKPDETTIYRPDSAQESLQKRLTILGLLIIAVFTLLFVRLWFMQIVGGTDYREKAEDNSIQEISLEAPRGRILDRNGEVLVKNRSALTISVVPAEMPDDGKVIERLSKLLGMGEDQIKYKIERSQAPKQRAVLIKSDVGEDIVTYVREHEREFPGVIAGTKPMREYPNGTLAAHVIGYMGEISQEQLEEKEGKGYLAGDEIGLSGVECVYDEDLRGEVGTYCLKVDATGEAISVLAHEEPRAGLNMRLTLDKNIQAVVENALATQVEVARNRYDRESEKKYAATGAAAVVLDPKNGEVIAMASYPTFDLNQFVGGISDKNWKELNEPENDYPLNNRAIMSQLPPGSVFKVVTAVGALVEGTFNMQSPFDCQGIFTKGEFKDYPKHCWSKHGHINLFNGIVQSCDIVFYEIGYNFYTRQLSNDGKPLWEYARDFQLGKPTGIDLVSEMDGRVPTPEWKREYNRENPELGVWWPGDTVNMAIGQGDLLATPLQIAYLYAGIANGGEFAKPHLMMSFEDMDGNEVEQADLETTAVIDVDEEIIGSVVQALRGVVQGKGTAAATFSGFPLQQIPVAGKTGTSEIMGKQSTAWFVCFAPADDPQYVVAVAIEEGGHGGESAAPVARMILDGLFNLQTAGDIQPSVGD